MKKFIKKKYLISFCFGVIAALAFAPIYFFPAAIISLSAFYFLLEDAIKYDQKKGEKNRLVVKTGFFYGFGYFLAGTYWIAISLLVDAKQFAWLIPFALTLIPAILALYFLFFAVSYKWFLNKFKLSENYQKILAFAFFWLVFEILRSYLFTGFPWNLLGYVWMFNVAFAQAASIFSVYGLTVLAVLIGLVPVLFFKLEKNKLVRKKLSQLSSSDKIFAGLLLLLFVANAIYGYCRIDDKKLVYDEDVQIRLVQANIKQEMKWDRMEKYNNLLKHIELTNSKDSKNIKAVIWSETSVPYVIDKEDSGSLLVKLREAFPRNSMLITGALRMGYEDDDKTKFSDVWNSVFVIDDEGVNNFYDKHHLVPFGEYVPLQEYLPFIQKITDGAVGFSEGDGPQTLVTPYFSFSPLLCYEAIFPDEVVNKKSRPDLLVNLTNDSWFGNSSGPYQHFDMVRMRSIEQGIPLVRVANSGITAFIDPFGRVVSSVNLNQFGIIDITLIRKLEHTIYSAYQITPLIFLCLVLLVCSIRRSIFSTLKPRYKNDFRQDNTS